MPVVISETRGGIVFSWPFNFVFVNTSLSLAANSCSLFPNSQLQRPSPYPLRLQINRDWEPLISDTDLHFLALARSKLGQFALQKKLENVPNRCSFKCMRRKFCLERKLRIRQHVSRPCHVCYFSAEFFKLFFRPPP